MKKLGSRHYGLIVVVVLGVVAQLWYRSLGVHFSAEPLTFYIQFLDPELLRHDLLRSLFYLRDQPPLFNAFLGAVLKLFPLHYAQAFEAIYVAGGIAFGVILYELMVRMRVAPVWAVVVTVLFVDSPITILYETWLFYTFPLAIVLCGTALALQRYLSTRRFRDASIFFWLVAILVLARNIFHPLWMLSVVGALIAVERGRRPTVTLAALAPTLVVVALLVKHLVVFHTLFQGRPIQQMNLAAMTSIRLPEAKRARLIREGKLTPLSDTPITAGPDGFRRLVPPQPKTGIPVLDADYKTGSGFPNWNNTIYVPVGERYGEDAAYVLSHHPSVYVQAVRENFDRYVLPSDQVDPFKTRAYESGQDMLVLRNRQAVRPLLTPYNRLFAWQQSPEGTPILHWIGFPLLLIYALAVIAGAIRGRRVFAAPSLDPAATERRSLELTVAYTLYVILWLSAITLFFSYSDHNRYRFKVSAFYCLFLALFGQWTWAAGHREVRRLRARAVADKGKPSAGA